MDLPLFYCDYQKCQQVERRAGYGGILGTTFLWVMDLYNSYSVREVIPSIMSVLCTCKLEIWCSGASWLPMEFVKYDSYLAS